MLLVSMIMIDKCGLGTVEINLPHRFAYSEVPLGAAAAQTGPARLRRAILILGILIMMMLVIDK